MSCKEKELKLREKFPMLKELRIIIYRLPVSTVKLHQFSTLHQIQEDPTINNLNQIIKEMNEANVKIQLVKLKSIMANGFENLLDFWVSAGYSNEDILKRKRDVEENLKKFFASKLLIEEESEIEDEWNPEEIEESLSSSEEEIFYELKNKIDESTQCTPMKTRNRSNENIIIESAP